jgi:hypothetical protein
VGPSLARSPNSRYKKRLPYDASLHLLAAAPRNAEPVGIAAAVGVSMLELVYLLLLVVVCCCLWW